MKLYFIGGPVDGLVKDVNPMDLAGIDEIYMDRKTEQGPNLLPSIYKIKLNKKAKAIFSHYEKEETNE